jgi:hypothetical protein
MEIGTTRERTLETVEPVSLLQLLDLQFFMQVAVVDRLDILGAGALGAQEELAVVDMELARLKALDQLAKKILAVGLGAAVLAVALVLLLLGIRLASRYVTLG